MAFMDPNSVLPYFELRPDMQVADFGCGSGAYALAMSRAVLPNGKIYAVDVQRDLLVTLKNQAQGQNIRNLEFLWGDLENLGGSKIADHRLDFVLVSNILFQMEDKGYKLALEIKRVLKPDGRVAVIDWSDSFNNLGPSAQDVVTKEAAQKTFAAVGFALTKEFPAGEHHYGLIFNKQ